MSATSPPSNPEAPPTPSPEMEFAHVLFMDIVGYSLLPMDQQTGLLQRLQQVVSATAAYRKAQGANQLISLPTGDGMALVFSGDPLAPVQCAVAVSQALRAIPEIKLRMGLHSGPVYRMADINANRNVAGGGINMAQRVMDCGDAGHILLSRQVADTLLQLSNWASHLQDLGEQVVKHGVRIHIYNLYTGDAGNPALPQKMSAAGKASVGAIAQSGKKTGWVVGAVLAAILIAGGAWYWFGMRSPQKPPDIGTWAPAHSFSYSVMVQRYQNGKPYRDPFVLPGEMIFEQDYHIRLMIDSPQPAYLYVLNEGPVSAQGAPSYNILFPGRDDPGRITPGQSVQIPGGKDDWFVFDAQEGVEQLWLVWSSAAVPVLEQARSFGDPEHRGAISDAALVAKIQEFLRAQQASPPGVVRDDANHKTTVSGSGDTLAKLVRLEHH
jgi:class 3 adenylate cyclase